MICDESIFLNKSDDYYDIPDQNKYDSPAMILLKYNNNMSLKQARDHFVEISDISPDDFPCHGDHIKTMDFRCKHWRKLVVIEQTLEL